ncbi:MAG TPA: hypothetical protein VMV89_11705 [Candidatus Paceibacterota bacterium]|nr:hypothetical protein [Candidatus Paceibacterota bacterium]
MNKKNYALIAIVLVLAGFYVIHFTDWFRPKTIHISHTSRSIRLGGQTGPANNLVFFGLEGDYSLTEVKVVPVAALRTNQLAQPVWHLVSDEGSDDVNQFFYGERIQGMDPAVSGAQPEPLQSGVVYRLFITAGKVRGQQDFQLGASPASTATNP